MTKKGKGKRRSGLPLNWRQNPRNPRQELGRLLGGLNVNQAPLRGLQSLFTVSELTQSELKGQVANREEKIRKLTQDLKEARDELAQPHARKSDDELTNLYYAGAQLVSKQANEIRVLKKDIQRVKDGGDRLKKTFADQLQHKDNQVAQVEREKVALDGTVQDLEARLASLTTDHDAASKVEQQLQDARSLIATLNGFVDNRNRVVDGLRASEARLLAEGADMFARLRHAEQLCYDWQATSDDQVRQIQQLADERARLLAGMASY